MEKRITPENIEGLLPWEVFVFGANESGKHGAGAARLAHDKFGAQYNVGFGPTGSCFAIPTKDWNIKTLPIESIKFYVDRFIEFTKQASQMNFYVTKIGTGLSGYKIEEIAPLFKEAKELKNIYLPIEFIEYE